MTYSFVGVKSLRRARVTIAKKFFLGSCCVNCQHLEMQELRSCKSAGLKLAGIHDLAVQARNLEAPHFGGLPKTTLPDSNAMERY